MQYSLRKKSCDAGTTASVIQFPVRLAYAITAHKVQGQSLLHPMKVAMNINSAFEAGQVYVMLSRIQSIDQLIIVDDLDEKKIMTSCQALDELERLEKISFNRNPSPWHSIPRYALPTHVAQSFIQSFRNSCIHEFIHVCIHPSIHAYMHTFTLARMHACEHACSYVWNAFVRALFHS